MLLDQPKDKLQPFQVRETGISAEYHDLSEALHREVYKSSLQLMTQKLSLALALALRWLLLLTCTLVALCGIRTVHAQSDTSTGSVNNWAVLVCTSRYW